MTEIATRQLLYTQLVRVLKLIAPTISIEGDYLQITENDERATNYDIYVDGVKVATIGG